MALCATVSKACRFFHFFRQGWIVEPKESGMAFTYGRGKNIWGYASSSYYYYPGRRGITFWFEKSVFSFTCKSTVIHRSMLGGSRLIIHQQVLVAGSKTGTHLGDYSEGSKKLWPWCWRRNLGTSPSDLIGCSCFTKESWQSCFSLPSLRRKHSAANDGHLPSLQGPIQSEDLILPPKPVPWDLMLEGCSTSDGSFQVGKSPKCRDPVVNLDGDSLATPRQTLRTRTCNEGPKVGIRLTPSYVIQLLQRQEDPNLALMFFKWAGLQSGYKHTFGTYSALIEALVRSKMFRALQQVKKEIEAQGLGSSTVLLRELAISFSQGGLVEEAIECLKQMEDLGYPPGLRLYNNLVSMLFKAGFPDRAHLLYRRMIQAGDRPDYTGDRPDRRSYTVNNLLTGYAKISDLVNLRRVYEEMKHQSCKPTAVTIAILLNVLCKEEKVDEAWNLFASNKDVANVVVINTMLHGLCKVGRTEQALELFQQMKKKVRLETATFNILIHGLGLASRTKDAIQLFQSMVDCEVKPDILTYNVALKLLIKDGRLQEAYVKFKEMATNGLTPDAVTYCSLIHGFCKKGDLDSACQLFIRMRAICPESDASVCTSALCEARESDVGVFSSKGSRSTFLRVHKVLCSHLLKAGRVHEAHELFGETAKADSELFLYAYNAAIHRLGSAGDIDKAWKLFQSMSLHGCKPDVVTYNTLISSLGKAKQVDRACELFLDMQYSGFKPDVVTCTTLVHALCKSGRAQEALDLFKEMQVQGISPNVFTYHSLFDGLCRKGQFSRAYMLYEEMINKHCSPNQVMYRSLIRGFSSAGHLLNLSYRLYIEMLEKGYSLDPLTSYMLVRSLRRAGKTDEVLYVVSRLSRRRKL